MSNKNIEKKIQDKWSLPSVGLPHPIFIRQNDQTPTDHEKLTLHKCMDFQHHIHSWNLENIHNKASIRLKWTLKTLLAIQYSSTAIRSNQPMDVETELLSCLNGFLF